MNLGEMAVRARKLVDVHMDNILDDELILSFLNEAYVEICTMRKWRWMEKTDYPILYAGSNLVSTDDGVNKVQEVVLRRVGDTTVAVKARPTNSTLSDTSTNQNFGNGITAVYDVQEGSIVIFPSFTTDVEVGIRYQLSPHYLQINEEPRLPDIYHMAIVWRACAKILNFMGDETNRMTFFNQEYQAILERLVYEYVQEHNEEGFIMNGGRRY